MFVLFPILIYVTLPPLNGIRIELFSKRREEELHCNLMVVAKLLSTENVPIYTPRSLQSGESSSSYFPPHSSLGFFFDWLLLFSVLIFKKIEV